MNLLTKSILPVFFALAMSTAMASDLERQFDVGSGGKLIVDTNPGKLDIRTGGTDVQVEVLRSGERADEFLVEFEQKGNEVTIRGEWPSELSSWRSRPRARIEYRITIPSRFDLDLSTSGGSIRVEDLDGELRAQTSGGAMSFGMVSGEVNAYTSGGSITLEGGGADANLNTSGGSIRVGEVAGDLKATTSGGSIRIAGVSGNVQANTSGGSVEATLRTQPTSDCRLSTSGGTVTLNLSDAFAVNIDASSSGGGVRSDFPIEGKTKSKRRLRGAINGGGPLMRLKSSGGGVRIRRGG
ncbi:MAG: DUF4097 domain-containing protein [Gammaproteobacteria bacterium]